MLHGCSSVSIKLFSKSKLYSILQDYQESGMIFQTGEVETADLTESFKHHLKSLLLTYYLLKILRDNTHIPLFTFSIQLVLNLVFV
jgi:hypothetical protein